MQYGVCIPHYRHLASPDIPAGAARAAEGAGFDSVWVSDHIVMSEALVQAFGEAFLEPFAVLAYLAGITSRVRLGISCAILPYRHPLLVAKEVATIDQLSGGRVVFGAAVGWAQGEFEALGVPFRRRGAITDEALEVITVAWTEAVPSFEGRFYKFDAIKVEPKPVQKPHPPVWVGGVSDKGVDRAVRFGSVWHPTYLPLEVLEERVRYLREAAAKAGKKPPAVAARAFCQLADQPLGEGRRTWFGSPEEVAADVRRHAELGVSYVLVEFMAPDKASLLQSIEKFASRVVPLV
ncbi:MAG: LLM class F420-dependent oxidoreductase [Chloroflexi bacterium]|nr:LLM class F420-dependent oxidoreductase [Chloroflexota bacterium]